MLRAIKKYPKQLEVKIFKLNFVCNKIFVEKLSSKNKSWGQIKKYRQQGKERRRDLNNRGEGTKIEVSGIMELVLP